MHRHVTFYIPLHRDRSRLNWSWMRAHFSCLPSIASYTRHRESLQHGGTQFGSRVRWSWHRELSQQISVPPPDSSWSERDYAVLGPKCVLARLRDRNPALRSAGRDSGPLSSRLLKSPAENYFQCSFLSLRIAFARQMDVPRMIHDPQGEVSPQPAGLRQAAPADCASEPGCKPPRRR